MPIVWRDQLNIGNDQIDTEHRYLICLFNSIELCLKQKDAINSLPIFIDQLFSYTKEHFTREEHLQKKIGFADYEKHHLKHKIILDHLQALNRKLKGYKSGKVALGEDKEYLKELDRDLLQLAREWIIDHIIKEDMEMKKYLQQYPANYS